MASSREKDDALEVIEALADVAVVAAHYLLDFAPKDSNANLAARAVLNVVNIDVRHVLQDRMIQFCPKCGTSGNDAVMNSSRRHARCRAEAEDASTAPKPVIDSVTFRPDSSFMENQ